MIIELGKEEEKEKFLYPSQAKYCRGKPQGSANFLWNSLWTEKFFIKNQKKLELRKYYIVVLFLTLQLIAKLSK